MDVRQAVLERRSIRAYLPRVVPREVIEKILGAALWSPSACNAQSWHVAVVSGKAREQLSEALVKAAIADPKGQPDVPLPSYTPEWKARQQYTLGKLYAAQGIAREDKERRMWFGHQMLRFFGAPTAVLIHTRRSLLPYVLQDIGLIEMTIMLLAMENELGTCPMTAPVEYPTVIREQLGIPEENAIPAAMSLGYPDLSAPVNNYPRDRGLLSELVTLLE